tara:strand:- start:3065 stop:3247 length:183 start_codon:yes stop_codon:yes gene_type:complete
MDTLSRVMQDIAKFYEINDKRKIKNVRVTFSQVSTIWFEYENDEQEYTIIIVPPKQKGDK